MSEPNDDGITALHNSICACYDDISRYLVLECSANVNAQELDGWSPLHCAAACGSLDMCRLLVENGASLLLPTLEDGENALEKAANLARDNGGFADGHAACEEYLHRECEEGKLGLVHPHFSHLLAFVVFYFWECGNGCPR